MARRAAVTDVLLALALGLEMQVELLFVDAPRREVLIARAAVLGLAGALLVRRRVPVLAAALGVTALILLETRGEAVNGDLAGPFFSLLFVAYSIGAYAEGRQLAAAATVLVGGVIIAVRLDDPPGG